MVHILARDQYPRLSPEHRDEKGGKEENRKKEGEKKEEESGRKKEKERKRKKEEDNANRIKPARMILPTSQLSGEDASGFARSVIIARHKDSSVHTGVHASFSTSRQISPVFQ